MTPLCAARPTAMVKRPLTGVSGARIGQPEGVGVLVKAGGCEALKFACREAYPCLTLRVAGGNGDKTPEVSACANS